MHGDDARGAGAAAAETGAVRARVDGERTARDTGDADDDDETGVSAELEIMIAEPAQRRRGLARTALQMCIA